MGPEEQAALYKVAEETRNFFGKIFGPAVDEIGQTFADSVKVRRLKNQIDRLNEVKALVQKEGITLKQVNLKVLFPYLEHVSLEEDKTLQDMWSKLLTNYIDSSKNLTITVYPNILGQLSTEEVRILNALKEYGHPMSHYHLFPNDWEKCSDRSGLLNLIRLGLVNEVVKIKYKETWSPLSRSPTPAIDHTPSGEYEITDFGHGFLNACSR